MKSKIYLLLFIIPLLFIQQGCNKDYPKDIPKWLKEKIKEREKECKNGGCYCTSSGWGCWTIYEWEVDTVVYYVVDRGYDGISPSKYYVEVYSVKGSAVGYGQYTNTDSSLSNEEIYKYACPILENGNINRTIWQN